MNKGQLNLQDINKSNDSITSLQDSVSDGQEIKLPD